MSTPTYQSVEGRIGYLLRRAQHALRVQIDRALSKYNITHPQFAVLSLLEYETVTHSADIARLCMFSPQAVNVIIKNLEKRNLVHRVPHKTHGRILTISLTALGKERLERCKKKVYFLEEKMRAPLSPQQEKTVREWLVHCATKLGRDIKQGTSAQPH